MLGTIDVGRVFSITSSAKWGGRGATYATRHPTDTSGINTAVMQHGVPADTAVTATVSGDCTHPLGGGSDDVRAEHTFTPIFFGTLSAIASGVDWNISVRATSRMRCMT